MQNTTVLKRPVPPFNVSFKMNLKSDGPPKDYLNLAEKAFIEAFELYIGVLNRVESDKKLVRLIVELENPRVFTIDMSSAIKPLLLLPLHPEVLARLKEIPTPLYRWHIPFKRDDGGQGRIFYKGLGSFEIEIQ